MATKSLCKIEGCGKPSYIRGWCAAHHTRWKRHGDPLAGRNRMPAKGLTCSIEGCRKSVHGKGLCITHYARLRKNGDPLDVGYNHFQSIEWIKAHADFAGDDCLIWPFGRFDTNGYARIMVDKVGHAAHRIMCIEAHGDPPTPEHEAAHNCGKGHEACVNPRHLRWATSKENHADRVLHGTIARGEKNGWSKLTAENVRQIRGLFGTVSQSDIARRFGVGKTTISYIRKRKSWAWLE